MQQLISEAADQAPAPDILVIHAGGNDLRSLKLLQLVNVIRADIDSWLARWPGLKVIWSNIINRYADSVRGVERSRKKVNKAIEKFVLSKGGSVVSHEDIDFKYARLYRADGEHLSDAGLDVFNKSLKDVLQRCV